MSTDAKYLDEKDLLILDPHSPPGGLFALGGLYHRLKLDIKKQQHKYNEKLSQPHESCRSKLNSFRSKDKIVKQL